MKEKVEVREEGEVLFSFPSGVDVSIPGVVIAPGADLIYSLLLTSLTPIPETPFSVCFLGEKRLRFKQQQRQHQQQQQQQPQLRFLFHTHQFRLSGRLKRQPKPADPPGVKLLVRSEDSPSFNVIRVDSSADDRGGQLRKEPGASKVSTRKIHRRAIKRWRCNHGDDDDDVNAPRSCPCARDVHTGAPVRHFVRRRQHRRHQHRRRRRRVTSVSLSLEDDATIESTLFCSGPAIRFARRHHCRHSRRRRVRHHFRRCRHQRLFQRHSCCHSRRLYRRRRCRRHRHGEMKVLLVKVECESLSSVSDDRATRTRAICNVNHPATHSLHDTFDVF